jgi:hypothetical protein
MKKADTGIFRYKDEASNRTKVLRIAQRGHYGCRNELIETVVFRFLPDFNVCIGPAFTAFIFPALANSCLRLCKSIFTFRTLPFCAVSLVTML